MNYIKHYTDIIGLLIILISVSLISCNPNFDPTLGTYTISFEIMEYGTAEVDKSQVGYNGEVTLTATPQDGYRFVNWTVEGKEVSKENPYTAQIIRNTQFRANFEKIPEYVDLGLSVKWATFNVGANAPEECGDYFAWGETEPKGYYYWTTYKWCNGTSTTMTKYCTYFYDGTVDNKTTLELEDDAARVNWGGSWRMPTRAEQDELINKNNCTWTWTTQNGVKGYKVTSKKNGNSIFLPVAGCYNYSDLGSVGSFALYWSSSLDTSYSSDGSYSMGFNSDSVNWRSTIRYFGLSVRAVCE